MSTPEADRALARPSRSRASLSATRSMNPSASIARRTFPISRNGTLSSGWVGGCCPGSPVVAGSGWRNGSGQKCAPVTYSTVPQPVARVNPSLKSMAVRPVAPAGSQEGDRPFPGAPVQQHSGMDTLVAWVRWRSGCELRAGERHVVDHRLSPNTCGDLGEVGGEDALARYVLPAEVDQVAEL